jgi:hypothetical protein
LFIDKSGLLDVCIALTVVGVVLVVFLWRFGVKFAQSSSQWEAMVDT